MDRVVYFVSLGVLLASIGFAMILDYRTAGMVRVVVFERRPDLGNRALVSTAASELDWIRERMELLKEQVQEKQSKDENDAKLSALRSEILLWSKRQEDLRGTVQELKADERQSFYLMLTAFIAAVVNGASFLIRELWKGAGAKPKRRS